jgi:hypothetical protein
MTANDPLPTDGATDALPRRGGAWWWRVAALVAPGVAGAITLWASGPIHQDEAYHLFVDHRAFGPVPNVLNVLSNVAFAVVGAAGLRRVIAGEIRFRDPRERWPWLVFLLGVTLTSVGSAWYHLAPSDGPLVWDRLPMSIGFMGLLAAVVAERVGLRAGVWLLLPLAVAGMSSVLYWWSRDDLRPYLFVQYYPLAVILLALVLFPSARGGTGSYTIAVGVYALAKVAELADRPVFAAGHVVSGHTLKHLLAAAAIGVLVRMLRVRSAADEPRQANPTAMHGAEDPRRVG